MPERVTRQLLNVLDVFLEDPTRELYGLEVMEAARITSGTLYPILHRLAADGWITRTRDAPSERGGAGRRLYRLTPTGRLHAIELLEERLVRKRGRRRKAAFRPKVQ